MSILSYNQLVWLIEKADDYDEWFKSQPKKIQAQIEKRLQNIQEHGHFGHINDLDDGLLELKFNNGNRIYYVKTGKSEITLILGGNKNGQNSDIKKAKNLING